MLQPLQQLLLGGRTGSRMNGFVDCIGRLGQLHCASP